MRSSHRRRRGRDGLAFGVTLVLLGMLFLFGRLGIYPMGDFWEWWPFIPILFGLVRIVLWHSAEEVGSGVMLSLLGVWFLISTNEWNGLTWSDSWPLALVAVGAGMVARAILEPLFARQSAPEMPPGGEHHA
jgi:LiaF transmembrane domain